MTRQRAKLEQSDFSNDSMQDSAECEVNGTGPATSYGNAWMLEQLCLSKAKDDTSASPADQKLDSMEPTLGNHGVAEFSGRSEKKKMASQKRDKSQTSETPFIRGAEDRDKVDPNDIAQGSIEDCYFLAGLAGLAKFRPDQLRERINDNHDGTFDVTLFVQSGQEEPTKRVIRVTPSATITEDGNSYKLARGGDNKGRGVELWVQLFEAAFIQLQGGVKGSTLGGGSGGQNSRDAMMALTGNKSRRIMLSTLLDDALVEQVAELLKNRIIVTACTRKPKVKSSSGQIPAKITDNLIGDHRYTVFGINEQEVQLFNPHGMELKVSLTEFREGVSSLQVVDSAPPEVLSPL